MDGRTVRRTSPDRNPDAHQIAHETIREPARQRGTGWHRERAKLLLKRTTADFQPRGEKALERLRA
jgi:hypothetical protein